MKKMLLCRPINYQGEDFVGNSNTEKAISTSAIDTRLTIEEFSILPFEAKRIYLNGLLPSERVEMILEDQDDKKLTWAMQPQEV